MHKKQTKQANFLLKQSTPIFEGNRTINSL